MFGISEKKICRKNYIVVRFVRENAEWIDFRERLVFANNLSKIFKLPEQHFIFGKNLVSQAQKDQERCSFVAVQ